MRTLIALLFILLCLPALAVDGTNKVNVTVTYADFQLTYQQVKKTTLTPLAPFGDYGGTTLLTPSPRQNITSSSGSTTFSNVISGYSYRLALDTPFGSTVRTCGFPAQLTGTVSVVTYLGDLHAMTFYYLYRTNEVLLGAQTNILVANIVNAGNLAYSNASAFLGLVTNVVLSASGALTNDEAREVRFDNGLIVSGGIGLTATAANIEGEATVVGQFGVNGQVLFPDGAIDGYVWTVTNQTTGAGAWKAPNATGGGGSNDLSKIYVAPNGNAFVSGRGTPDNPTSRLYDWDGVTRSGAFATATNGDTILIAPGTYIAPALPINDGVTVVGLGLPTILRTNRISSTNNIFLPTTADGHDYLRFAWLQPGDNVRVEGIKFDVSRLAVSNAVYASVFVNRTPVNYIPDGTTVTDVGGSIVTYLTNGGHVAPTPFVYYEPLTGVTNKYSTNVFFKGNQFKSVTDIVYPQSSWQKFITYRYGSTNDPQWIPDPDFPDEHNWAGMTWYYTSNTFMGDMNWTFENNLWEHKWDGIYFSGDSANVTTINNIVRIRPEHPGSGPTGFKVQNGARLQDFGSTVIIFTNNAVSYGFSLLNGANGHVVLNGTRYFATNSTLPSINYTVGSSGSLSGNYIDTNNVQYYLSPITTSFATLSNNTAEIATNIPPRGYVWNAAPTVMIGFDSWNAFQTHWFNTNANSWGSNTVKYLTNTIYWMGTNTVEYGVDTISITDNWENPARDANGDLTWHTNAWGNLGSVGVPYICALAHSNGVKIRLYTAYADLTCGDKPGSPIDKIRRDIHKFMSWGVDGIAIDSCDDSSNGNGVYTTNRAYIRAYLRVVNQAIEDYHIATASTNGYVRPMTVQLNPTLDNLNPAYYNIDELYGQNILSFIYDPIPGGYYNSFTNVIKSVRTGLGFRGWTGPGHTLESGHSIYLADTDLGMITNLIAAKLIGCEALISQIGSVTGDWTQSGFDGWFYYTNFLRWVFQNREIMDAWRDGPQIAGYVAMTNTQPAEVWVRPLGGQITSSNAVLLINLNRTNSVDVTLTSRHFGGYSNRQYVLRDPWRHLDVTQFVGGVTMPIPPTNAQLYLVREAPLGTTNYGPWALYNTNSLTANPALYGNLVIGHPTASAISLGLYNAAHPFLMVDNWANQSGLIDNFSSGIAIAADWNAGNPFVYFTPTRGIWLGDFTASVGYSDPGRDNLLVVSNITSAAGRIVSTNGYRYTSNTYPITSWASLGNCGCITWMSNATLYLICTNSINGNATTNKLGGL